MSGDSLRLVRRLEPVQVREVRVCPGLCVPARLPRFRSESGAAPAGQQGPVQLLHQTRPLPGRFIIRSRPRTRSRIVLCSLFSGHSAGQPDSGGSGSGLQRVQPVHQQPDREHRVHHPDPDPGPGEPFLSRLRFTGPLKRRDVFVPRPAARPPVHSGISL